MPIRDPQGTELTVLVASKLHLLRRRWVFVAAPVAACLVLAFLYLILSRPLYEATAQVLVLQQGGRPSSVLNADPSQASAVQDDFLPTQMTVLMSPRVVADAIESVGINNLPSLASENKPSGSPTLAAIKSHLKVTRPERDAMTLKLTYTAWSPPEATRMLTALIDSYERFLVEHYQKNNSKMVSLIAKARDDLNVELADLESKHLELVRKAPILASEEAGRGLITRRIERWEAASRETKIKSIQLKSQLEAVRKMNEQGMGLASVAYMVNQLGGEGSGALLASSGSSQSMATDFLRQLAEKQQTLADRHGPDFSGVKEVRDQISRVVELSRESRQRLEKADVKDLIGSIEQGLVSLERSRGELDAQLERGMAEVEAFAVEQETESHLRANLERQRLLFHAVVDQLKQLELGGDFSNVSAHTLERPNTPLKAVYPRTSRTLLVALLGGIGLGIALALLVELWDARIRTFDELRELLEYPVVGAIPRLPEDQLVACHSVPFVHVFARSLPAEAFRSLRTNLELSRRTQKFQTLMVTSPDVGDGKSMTATNLAASLADGGRRVLLIDADLRDPSLHRSLGLDRGRGLIDILKGEKSFHSVVQKTAVGGLDVVTAGPHPNNPAELLMMPRLLDALEQVREAYDTIIVDSAPLLACTDPALVGAQVDGILLVVRELMTRRHDVVRTREILEALATPVLGLSINGLDPLGTFFGPGGPIPAIRPYGSRGPEVRTANPDVDASANGHPKVPVV